jgi:hypothetical protein
MPVLSDSLPQLNLNRLICRQYLYRNEKGNYSIIGPEVGYSGKMKIEQFALLSFAYLDYHTLCGLVTLIILTKEI